MASIKTRVERLEVRKPDQSYLVVWPDEADEAAIAEWQHTHPNGRVIRIVYEDTELPEVVLDDIGA
jgi:hypothetical protein